MNHIRSLVLLTLVISALAACASEEPASPARGLAAAAAPAIAAGSTLPVTPTPTVEERLAALEGEVFPTAPDPTATPVPLAMPTVTSETAPVPTPIPIADRVGLIAYDSRDGMALHLTKARGHTVSKVISNLPGDHRFPEISPGGTKLAFASETAPDRSDIFVMDLVGLVITPSTSTLLSEEFTGSVPTQLTDESRYDTSPSWSPDATRLAYLSKPSGGDPRHPLWHVWVVNADGTGAVDLTPNANTGYDLDRLSWVPDGSKIAATRNGAIMVVNVDGTGARQITDEGKGLSNPVWSPDGSEIAVRGTRSDFFNTSIYIIPAEGGHEKRVTVPLNDMTTGHVPSSGVRVRHRVAVV